MWERSELDGVGKNQDKSKSSINDVLQEVSQQKVNEVTHPNTVKEQANEKVCCYDRLFII